VIGGGAGAFNLGIGTGQRCTIRALVDEQEQILSFDNLARCERPRTR